MMYIIQELIKGYQNGRINQINNLERDFQISKHLLMSQRKIMPRRPFRVTKPHQ